MRERERQMNRKGWVVATVALVMAMALPGCFTAEPPDVFKCGNNASGCQEGHKCDPIKGVCVPEDTRLDGRVDGPVVDGPVADAGKDMAADRGKDVAVDRGKDVAVDRGKEAGIKDLKPDQPVPDQKVIPDKTISPDKTVAVDQKVSPDKTVAVDQKVSPDQGTVTPAKWVTVKAGLFQMGSPTSETCREPAGAPGKETQHQVTLTGDFELQETEVTQGQFKAAMGYNPSTFSACGADCPVDKVNWHEAAAYCTKLAKDAGLAPCYTCTGSGSAVFCQETSETTGKGIYSCAGHRLPTEAEWEFAYRAGTTTAYYTGKQLAACTQCGTVGVNATKAAWYCANSTVSYAGCVDLSASGGPKCAGTRAARGKVPNVWGLYDMAGNLNEWCHDPWQLDLGSTAVTDPVGTGGKDRVNRGGSFQSQPNNLRAASRNYLPATSRYHHSGFRCARSAVPAPTAHWKFDEGTGTVAKDSGAGKYDGSIAGATWISGVKGYGLRFTGTSDYVKVNLKPVWKSTDSFSVSLWARTAYTGKNQTLIGFQSNTQGNFWITNYLSGEVGAYIQDDGKNSVVAKAKSSYIDGSWHLFTAVRDAKATPKKLRLYVDGVLAKEVTDTTTTTINATSPLPLTIGANTYLGAGSFSNYFKGDLDDVKVFDTALTAGQVKLLYESAPSCSDKIQNGHETDVDCGGSRCNKCADTKKCSAVTDCLSGVCTNKVCAKGCKHQPVVKDCYKDASGVEWCKVPGGCFLMGSPASEPCRYSDEKQHQVTLTHNFEIQKTEVTQGEFLAAMGYSGSHFTACGTNCPVDKVNWHESAAYCNKLSQNAGSAACYTCTGSGQNVTCQETVATTGKGIYACSGYRLPTEAEGEYAHRAGTTTAYYSGNNNSSLCTKCSPMDPNANSISWYCHNSAVSYAGCYDASSKGGPKCAGIHPVGQKLANGWGLYDMAGNVAEWGHDWKATYPAGNVSDPVGSSGTMRVSGGSNWYASPIDIRAARRDAATPSAQGLGGYGIRCVRTIEP